jgi:hypothetical protein
MGFTDVGVMSEMCFGLYLNYVWNSISVMF